MRPGGDPASLLPRTHTTRKREERKKGERGSFYRFFLGASI
jgi:hypothetical protein